jgi:hypothetical protein
VSFPVVVHALEQLRQDGDEKAGQYLAAILRFESISCGRQVHLVYCHRRLADRRKPVIFLPNSQMQMLCPVLCPLMSVHLRLYSCGFLHAKSTRGQALATLLLDTMDEYEVDGDKLRAQGYDGAANMRLAV